MNSDYSMAVAQPQETVNTALNFSHLQEAVSAVDQRIAAVRNGTEKKIKASAGFILTTTNPQTGDLELLMGRLNKLDRPKPKDTENVHNTFGSFSGSVETEDANSTVPAVCQATAREVAQETLGALNRDQVLFLLSLPTTRLIKNAGWKHFTAATFHVNISNEQAEKIEKAFNHESRNTQQHEITQLARISYQQIMKGQREKNEKYDVLKSQLEKEQERPFTAEELQSHSALSAIYKQNVQISSGNDAVAHYVARTIFSLNLGQ